MKKKSSHKSKRISLYKTKRVTIKRIMPKKTGGSIEEKDAFLSQVHYDNVRDCDYINARKLCASMKIKGLPYKGVTDQMIDN